MDVTMALGDEGSGAHSCHRRVATDVFRNICLNQSVEGKLQKAQHVMSTLSLTAGCQCLSSMELHTWLSYGYLGT